MYKKVIIFNLFILTFFLNALPAYTSDKKEEAVPGAGSVIKNCLTREWEKHQCKFSTIDKFPYNPGIIARNAGDFLYDSIRLVNRGFTAVYDLGAETCLGVDFNEGFAYLSSLEKNLKRIKKKRNLSDCQAACMALCVAPSAIKYSSATSSMQTSCTTLASGKGKCGDFTTLADQLLGFVGIKSESEYGVYNSKGKRAAHSFIKLKIGDSWYYVEPQSSRCRFYKL